jgi:hypothetical protein
VDALYYQVHTNSFIHSHFRRYFLIYCRCFQIQTSFSQVFNQNNFLLRNVHLFSVICEDFCFIARCGVSVSFIFYLSELTTDCCFQI